MTAAHRPGLHRRADDGAERAEHAAVPFVGADQCPARRALMEVDARIRWHRRQLNVPAARTAQLRGEIRHAAVTVASGGSSASRKAWTPAGTRSRTQMSPSAACSSTSKRRNGQQRRSLPIQRATSDHALASNRKVYPSASSRRSRASVPNNRFSNSKCAGRSAAGMPPGTQARGVMNG